MTLRHFMKYVIDQNWFAVGLNVIVVITGIFLGMHLSEWNEEQTYMNLALADNGNSQTLTVLTGDNTRNNIALIKLITDFMDRTEFKYQIEFMNWSRAYEISLTQENTLIFELDKTAERSKLFNWILPLNKRTYVLAAKNTKKMKAFQIEHIYQGKYKALCIDKTFPCDVFLIYGFSEEDIIRIPYFKLYDLQLLLDRNRADIVIASKESLLLPENKLIPLLDEFKITGYLSASKNLDQEILKKLLKTAQNY